MADYALDIAFEQVEHYHKYKDAPLHVQYDEGIIDEQGITLGQPWSTPIPQIGVGCPRCGGDLVLKTGRYGKFYGCKSFPRCKGARRSRR